MKKTLLLAGFLLSLFSKTAAQELSFSANYQYLYAPHWDEMIQVYNSSRPYLQAPQPFMEHGIGLNIGYIQNLKNLKWQLGTTLSYAWFSSSAEQEYARQLDAHLIDLGVLLQFRPQTQKGIWIQVQPSVLLPWLHSRQPDDPNNEDYQANALGVGFGINSKLGWQIPLSNQLSLSPSLGYYVSPAQYNPNALLLIQQINRLDLLRQTSYLMRTEVEISINYFFSQN